MKATESLYIDIKTRSVCDLRHTDPRVYCENWSTDVWVVGYAIGQDHVKLWYPADPVPEDLTRALTSGLPIISYDARFVRALFINIMGPRYGWPIPPLQQFVCMAAMASAMGLPSGLDDAAEAMGFAECKDKETRSLMRRMTRPHSKTKVRCHICGMMTCNHAEFFRTNLTWWDGDEDRARLGAYCAQEVSTARALYALLRPLSESEREVWLRDQASYERGMGFDSLFLDPTQHIQEGQTATADTKPAAPEIVPNWIRAHVTLVHSLATPLIGQGKVIAAGFGENPDETDPKSGKSGRALPPKVIHAAIGDVNAMLEGLAQFVKRQHYNLYMPLAVFRPDLASWAKGYERDVVACLGIVADFDDPDAPRWAQRLPIPPNYVLETSTGRFQAFYLFDKPEPLEIVKPAAERLKAFAGCDHGTSDISHVWRVPGAMNWPNAKKVAAGRPRDPQLVRVEMYSEDRTSLQALSDALPEAEVSSESKKSSTRSKHAEARPTGTEDPEAPKGKAHSPHRAAIDGTPENLNAIARMQSLPSELQDEIKRPVPRGNRSEVIFKVIAKMLEEGLDDKTIENIIRAHPSGIGEKYADRDDLDREIARVREKIAAPTQVDVVTSLILEMNDKYAVVDDDGKTVVVYRREDSDLDRKYVVRSSYRDFRNFYLNARILVPNPSGNGLKPVTHADLWLCHPERRTYKGGLRFLPGTNEGPSDVYNLWTGWGVDPAPGDWSKMKSHINEVLCSGSAEYFEYVMDWLARAVQKPGEPGEVALVLRGARGAGKGIFARTVGALFGQHFLHLSNARHLTGNFNAHLRDACLVFADEAFYAGDKQHEGQLKRLVTEPTLMIEAKYANAVPVRNCLHLIVASNDDWVVPAGTDERRFFVLDVSSIKRADYQYFETLELELKNGGLAAMLHDLLHRDISGFNVRSAPETTGLVDQKVRSLRAVEAWWHEILQEGNIPGVVGDDSPFPVSREHWIGPVKVNRDTLYKNYLDFSKERKEYRAEDKSRLGKSLRRYVPRLAEERPRQSDTGRRDRLYLFPPLAECRAGFEKVIGLVEWDDA
jgi:hypothetical protein